MKINKEGLIESYSHKDIYGKRLLIPKNAIGLKGGFEDMITWLTVHGPKRVIRVEEGNPVFYVKDGCLIDRTSKTLVLATVAATIPRDGSIEHIGEYAFDGHTELRGCLSIPDGVKAIGECAFSGCTNITKVEIPRSVTKIASSAFNGCDALTEFSAIKNAKYYVSGNCLIVKRTKKLIAGCKTSVIPFGVTAIGDSAFANIETLTRIAVPDSVERIDDCAFDGCTALKNIALPKSLNKLGKDVFRDCQNIEEISVPFGVKYIDMYMFKDCTKLVCVTISDSVTSIELGAFEGCSSLAEVSVPGSVEYVGQWAFYGCRGMEKLTLGHGIKAIHFEAFVGCKFKGLVIPSSVTEIDARAFYLCTELKSVVFEDPRGWNYGGMTGLNESDLSDSTTAAFYLTQKYHYQKWSKKAKSRKN